jgi:predicted transcriptional regulator YdeE
MDPRPAVRHLMHVVGHRARTSNTLERDPATAQLPGLWDRVGAVLATHGPGHLCAVYFDYERDLDAPYSVVVGVEVPGPVQPARGMALVTAPAGDCLVYLARGPMPEALSAAWRHVCAAFPAGAPGRAYTFDVEIHRAAGVDLYVAVTPCAGRVRPGPEPA